MAKKEYKDQAQTIRKNIKRITSAWNTDEYAFEDKRTEKAKKMSNILTEFSFGNEDKKKFAKLISLASGEEVKVNEGNDVELRPLIALKVVKLSEKLAHTYETGSVVVHIGDGVCIMPDGKEGSPIPQNREVFEPASDKEIEDIPAAQIKGITKAVTLIFNTDD